MKKILLVVVFASFSQIVALAQSKSIDKLIQHVYTLASDSMKGRRAGTAEGLKAAQYIADQFAEIGLTSINENSYFQPFTGKNTLLSPQGIEYQNVVGIIEGSDPKLKDEFIVIGAHFDHLGTKTGAIYSGADDNASGTAIMIEVARALKEKQAQLSRSVIFVAFDAEELGLFGSAHFVAKPPVELHKIKLMINMDMVGYLSKGGALKYSGVKMLDNYEELLANINDIEGLKVKYKAQETMLMGSSDHESFARKEIPILSASTGLKSPYHKPADKADKIDYNGMALISEHVSNISITASQADHLRFSGENSFKFAKRKKYEFGVQLGLGTATHRYTSGPLTGKNNFAWLLGVTAQRNMGTFALKSGLEYERRYARHPGGKFFTDGLSVPFQLAIQLPENSPIQISLGVGLYYSCLLDGRSNSDKLDFGGAYNRNEGGSLCSVIFSLYKFNLGFTGKYAFTNLYSNPMGPNIHYQANYFTVGYKF